MQLHESNFTPKAGDLEGREVAYRECARRVAWSLVIRDRMASGGVEQFQALPQRWMRIPLPMKEDDFNYQRESCPGILSDHVERFGPGSQLGISAYTVLISNMHYDILR